MKSKMLEFDESYFKGEEIDGFYVEEDMKRAWAAQLEVLVELDRICKKYGLEWYAEYGTLIGAVRHKGFIPWDDDMDIAMKRADYMKFMEVAPKELPEGWAMASPQLDNRWPMPFARVVNGSGININKEFLQRFHGCPYTVGIDIFPLDYVPADKAELEVIQILYQHVLYVKRLMNKKDGKENTQERKQEVEEFLCDLEKTLCFKIDREAHVMNQLLRRLDDLSSLYQEDESEALGVICYMYPDTEKQRPKEWYAETILMPFENIEIPVPVGYDGVLRSTYGDYMTPVREPNDHYPFYASQKKQVQEILENIKKINEKMDKLEAAMAQSDNPEAE